MSNPVKIVPQPKPEDKRPLFKAEGPIPDGKIRAEVVRRCWASSNLRLFKGDVVDLSEADFELLHSREFVRQPWTKPQLKMPAK